MGYEDEKGAYGVSRVVKALPKQGSCDGCGMPRTQEGIRHTLILTRFVCS